MSFTVSQKQGLTIATFNIQGKKVNDKHKSTDFQNYAGYNFEKLSSELRKMNIRPNVISLTEVHIVDLRKFNQDLYKEINKVNYKIFTPKSCTLNKSCYKTSLGTCILVEENIAKDFSLCDAKIVNKVMFHGKSCDIRECRIKSNELEVVSLYVKSGLSKNDKQSKETLTRLTKEMDSKLSSSNKVVYLGDFNFNLNHFDFAVDFLDTVQDFKNLVKDYEPWYSKYEFSDIQNLFTHIRKDGKKVKLDYIISNLKVQDYFSSQTIPNFSDHKLLVVLFKDER
ncbi:MULTISPECIES: hypothetical protein [Streptococcus]|uniref:Exonuclease III n=2 Tax=Streptococcus TaxID=1301 RepID=A0ABS2PU97_9STRE|nr:MULTISPECIES: hypothetical protein [Streptococcus]MBM7635909.1 exonuclease III [Streptococcus saliviloxodontae]MBM7643622.1 exonuclease III [Streptococcus loxodontisalivarius]